MTVDFSRVKNKLDPNLKRFLKLLYIILDLSY